MNEIADKQILIVDDDKIFLKIVSNTLRKAYSVKQANNGEEALEILKNGYKPSVIFSDHEMPGMNGVEFLRRSIDYVANASRIVITAHNDSKLIIKYINESKAFMYLTKPCSSLDLFQAALLGYNSYHDKTIGNSATNKQELIVAENKLIDNLKEEIDRLTIRLIEEEAKLNKLTAEKVNISLEFDNSLKKVQLLEENQARLNYEIEKLNTDKMILESQKEKIEKFPLQINSFFEEMISKNEHFYFTPHTKSVFAIANYLADRLNYHKEKKINLLMASNFHNIGSALMPPQLVLSNPAELPEKYLRKYFKYFNESVRELNKIDNYKESALIISKIWERSDGTGYPLGLADEEIPQESHIIALANIYHLLVYGVNIKDLEILFQKGTLEQDTHETQKRHKEAIKKFYKMTKWYDYDVFRLFMDAIKDRELSELVPAKNTLSINYSDFIINSDIELNELPEADEVEEANKDHIKEVTDDNLIYTERELHYSRLKAGMIAIEDIKTINNITALKANTVIDNENIRKLSHLAMNQMIPIRLKFKVPTYNY